MAKLPDPPPPHALRRHSPGKHTHVLPRGTWLWRIYQSAGAHPTTWSSLRTFGPSGSRFDHHEPPPHEQARGILYAGTGRRAIRTCLAEVFQATRAVDRTRDQPWLVGFRLVAPVSLLDLRGVWPTRAGASQAIATGPHARARVWSRAIYAAYPAIGGLLYRSSMNASEPAVALYERAGAALPRAPQFHRALGDPAVLRVLLGECAALGYCLL